MLKKDLAICIRAVDYSETSQILTLFTREAGKLSSIAKGSKRAKSAFDGPVELFAHGKIVYAGSGKKRLATLTEFQQQIPFSFLTRNLFALHCASLAAELVNSMTDDCDPHPELFDALIEFLENTDHVQNDSRDMLALLILFQLTLLKEAGLMPILSHCANCRTRPVRRSLGEGGYAKRNTQHQFYFSSSANGLICRDCESAFPDKIKLAASTVKALADRNNFTCADEKILRQIEKILIAHFSELLYRTPKTAKYVLNQ
jgi:DNA repair protein RecO (recombination protein O)